MVVRQAAAQVAMSASAVDIVTQTQLTPCLEKIRKGVSMLHQREVFLTAHSSLLTSSERKGNDSRTVICRGGAVTVGECACVSRQRVLYASNEEYSRTTMRELEET